MFFFLFIIPFRTTFGFFQYTIFFIKKINHDYSVENMGRFQIQSAAHSQGLDNKAVEVPRGRRKPTDTEGLASQNTSSRVAYRTEVFLWKVENKLQQRRHIRGEKQIEGQTWGYSGWYLATSWRRRLQ